jgi:gamma-glutamylcyclotransferase (GGCT)/AIG2-like uncharacterized protein YtfP
VSTSKKKQEKTEKGAKHNVTVFVYGTLKKDEGNYSLMQHIKGKFVGYDSITGRFRMTGEGHGFPKVCHTPQMSEMKIYGQVFEIPPDGLPALDGLEGHPRWYKREKLRTDKLGRRAWIYLMPEEVYRKNADNTVVDNMWRIRSEEEAFWAAQGTEFRSKAA